MIGTASLSFEQATEQLEGMVQHVTAFARMEDVINAVPLSDLHKAALWLLAWSLREPNPAVRRVHPALRPVSRP
jgi:hypothetical protein